MTTYHSSEVTVRSSVSVRIFAAVLLGLASLAVGPGRLAAGAQAGTGTKEVRIDNFTFGPADLTVPAGTTVTWVNRDDIPHTVVSTDKVFKSRVLDTSETFSFTFGAAGTFPYFCSLHPKMTGKVIVQ